MKLLQANDKIPDNSKYSLVSIQAAQNQKQINRGTFGNQLKLKIGAKVLLTVTVDIQNGLIRGQTRNIRHIEFVQGSICEAYVTFSDGETASEAITKLLCSY